MVTYLLADHVHRVLDPTVRNHRDDRRICDAEVAHSVHAELRVNHTLMDTLGETGSTAWVCRNFSQYQGPMKIEYCGDLRNPVWLRSKTARFISSSD